MDKPIRIQLKRTKGFNLQEHSMSINRRRAVKVDRTNERFGNPFRVDEKHTALKVVDMFREMISCKEMQGLRDDIRDDLRGKNLACWCKLDQPCHADVLLQLANKEPSNG